MVAVYDADSASRVERGPAAEGVVASGDVLTLNLSSQRERRPDSCLYRYETRQRYDDAQAAHWGCRWLSPVERQSYGRLIDPRRRSAFLLGRLLAKRLILSRCCATAHTGAAAIHPMEIEIDSGLAQGRRRSPRISIAGQASPWPLSIAHSDRAVLVALACEPDACVGVDLVEPTRLGRGFAELWFTAAERRHLQDGRPGLAAQLWAIKEAVYKAAGNGRPFAPRSIEVLPRPGGGFVSRPACSLAIWQTPQGETAVIAIRQNNSGTVPIFAGTAAQRWSAKMGLSPSPRFNFAAGEIL